MPPIPKHRIERARSADLVELVRQHDVELRPAGGELRGLCPFHEEQTPSFFVNPAKGVYRCHGCGAGGDSIKFVMQHKGLSFEAAVRELTGEVGDVEPPATGVARCPLPQPAATGLELVAPIPSDAPPMPISLRVQQDGQWVTLDAVASWEYRDAEGQTMLHVQRFAGADGKKTIRPLTLWRDSKTGELRWERKAYPGPRPLYGLAVLAQRPDARVWLAEGEKACDAARRLLTKAGKDVTVVVTWPGGANGVPHVDLEPLRGRKVVLWPDADAPGAKAADELTSRLQGIAVEVKRLCPPEGVEEGWDAANAEQDEGFDLLAFAKTARLVWPVPSRDGDAATPAAVQPASADAVKTTPLLPGAPTIGEPVLVNPEPIEAVENSEDDLALQFVERASNLRWSPGLGWMADDGVVWARDEVMHRFDLARRVCRAAAAACEVKAEAEAKRLSAAKTVAAVLTLAQADRRLVVPASAWDADPLLLNTPGGVVDLRAGTMRPRDIEYVTQVAAVAPDFQAACPIWLRFLGQVFIGDESMIEFMQRSMGYWLSGSTREQVIHFLYGQGSNGKSVLSDFVKWIAGSYALKLPATALMQARGERHPTELAQLRGKRLALSSELGEADYFNESLLKELSGDATLSARFMRGDFFEFPLTQKHLIVGNFKPRLRGGDPAIARRMLLVPFRAVFSGAERDAQLPAKLKGEAPAILAWMIRGAVKWHADGLAVPESVRTASAEYMAIMDDLKLWQTENCVMEGEAKARDLYADFAAWKKARGENAPSQTLWGERMATQPGIARRHSGGVKYVGIRLKPDEPGDWRTNTSYAHVRG